MKVAVTPINVSHIETLHKNKADIFIIGNEDYANRLVSSFSLVEIESANNYIKSIGKELYVVVNKMVHEQDISPITEFLTYLKELDIQGIIFSDLSVYMIAKTIQLEHKLIYNPDTLNTNYFDATFWSKKGIKGIVVSKEVSLEEIKQIVSNKQLEISMIGHGHLNMFHSRRPLIENFLKYSEEEPADHLSSKNLTIVEEIRNEAYPIYQDQHGTHIFREKPVQSYREILELENLDIFIIDGIFLDESTISKTVLEYTTILENKDLSYANELFHQTIDTHDTGFLYKKTIYDKGKEL